MDRKTFIRECGKACLGVITISTTLQGCHLSQQLTMPINKQNMMRIPLTAFISSGDGKKEVFRRFIVVRNDQLNYPIVVYRNSPENYNALLLRCSHQYNELQVSGDLLTCPAHGSEFDSAGEVVHGPAEDKLRVLAVTVDSKHLLIHLA